MRAEREGDKGTPRTERECGDLGKLEQREGGKEGNKGERRKKERGVRVGAGCGKGPSIWCSPGSLGCGNC